MNKENLGYRLFSKITILIIGFLSFIVQPISKAIDALSDSEKEVSLVDFDKEEQEKEERDFDENYIADNEELSIDEFSVPLIQHDYNKKISFLYINSSKEITIPPPKVSEWYI